MFYNIYWQLSNYFISNGTINMKIWIGNRGEVSEISTFIDIKIKQGKQCPHSGIKIGLHAV